MLVALSTPENSRIEANDGEKGRSYICPNCKCAVVFARGTKVRWHFKHEKNSACTYGGESWQHEQAKSAILDGARQRDLEATPELEILSIEGDRRADVIVWGPKTHRLVEHDQRRLAFEVQYSSLDCTALISRTRAYMAAGVPVVWIPVVDAQKFKSLGFEQARKLFRVPGYAAPVWIETIANFLGHFWLYVPQTNSFWRGWLKPHWLYKNPSEGYDSSGEYHSSGGYWYEAARKRDLYLEGPFEFSELRIIRKKCTASGLMTRGQSSAFLIDLVLPDEATPAICPVSVRRKPHIVAGSDTGYYSFEDWVQSDGDWHLAVFETREALPSLAVPNPPPTPPA
jgi:hypothetical protein